MGKIFCFQSALILFWLFFFITLTLCSADSAPSPTPQLFQEKEGNPENGNMEDKASPNHFDEGILTAIIRKIIYKKLFLQNPFIFNNNPYIQVPPPEISHIQRLSSSKPSIPIFDEAKPQVPMIKRSNFLLPIPFLRNLFTFMSNRPQLLQRPALKAIPLARNPKFPHAARFTRPIVPRPIPILNKPSPYFEKHIPIARRPSPSYEKHFSTPVPPMKRPIPEFERPILKPIPVIERDIPMFEKPLSGPIPIMERPILEFDKFISESISAMNDKSFPEYEKPISKSFPAIRRPISEPIQIMEKPLPMFEEPIPESIPTMEKPFPKFQKPILEPSPQMYKQILSTRKLITDNEKSVSQLKNDLLLHQSTKTIDPKSPNEHLSKKHIPTTPITPKFQKPLPPYKPIPPP